MPVCPWISIKLISFEFFRNKTGICRDTRTLGLETPIRLFANSNGNDSPTGYGEEYCASLKLEGRMRKSPMWGRLAGI